MSHSFSGCTTKRRFSELPSKPPCNQEYTSGLEQRLHDEAKPVVAQGEALVLQNPGIAALDRPAALAQSGSARPTTLVNVRLGAELAAEVAVVFGVIALVGEDRADASHDREGRQEQALEDERVVDIGCGDGAGHRNAVPVGPNVVFGAPLAAVGWVGACEVATTLGPHRAGVEDQVGMAAQHADQQRVHLAQHGGLGPAGEAAAQGRAAGLVLAGPQAAPGRTLAQKA